VGVAEGGPDHFLAVPDDEEGLVHPSGHEPVQQAGQEASPPEFDQALGSLLGQGSETLADARGENEAGQGFGPLEAAESSNWSSACFVLRRCTRSG
jgi:hypothetical protein